MLAKTHRLQSRSCCRNCRGRAAEVCVRRRHAITPARRFDRVYSIAITTTCLLRAVRFVDALCLLGSLLRARLILVCSPRLHRPPSRAPPSGPISRNRASRRNGSTRAASRRRQWHEQVKRISGKAGGRVPASKKGIFGCSLRLLELPSATMNLVPRQTFACVLSR